MFQYMSTIRELYDLKNIYTVHYYDETFCLLRKFNHQPWRTPIRELHDKALYRKRPNQIHTQPTRNNYIKRTYQPFPGPVTALGEVLVIELQGYDSELYNTLIEGFKFGFKLSLEGDIPHRISKNHKSATDNSDNVYEK